MTVNNISIERMQSSDIAAVAKAERTYFSTPWNESDLSKSLESDTTVFWLAKAEGELVGYISRMHSFETMDILTICVFEQYRRNGIASRLLAHLEREAGEKGVEKIFLEVRESNLGARSLYENNGYQLISTRKRYYSSPVEDALILQKEIV